MKIGEILELEIKDLAFGGKGVGRIGNFVMFVDGAIPGQRVQAKISKQKRRYAEAKLLEVLKPSPMEVETGFQSVPGAPWARIPIEKQMEFKRKQVFDLFHKFADIDLLTVLDEEILSPRTWNYRNKMEFSFGRNEAEEFALGSKKRGQFWLVENLEKASGLFDEDFESFVPEIRKFCEATDLPPYDQKTNEGFFRHLVVRKSFFQDRFLVNLVTTSKGTKKFPITKFIQLLNNKFDQRACPRRSLPSAPIGGSGIAGIFWSKNDASSDTATNFSERKLVFGQEKLIEKINDLEFEISLDSFFQTNPASAEKLYKKVIQYIDPKLGESILDLYCGTGTIAQVLAKNFPKTNILGVEIAESAVKDARKNAKRNKISNVEFVCADVRKFLKEKVQTLQSSNLKTTIVLDPPRAGIAPKALNRVIEFLPEKIVYVSCNPATLARDTAMLTKAGYQLKKLSIVDQFPHTSHVECVGQFMKK